VMTPASLEIGYFLLGRCLATGLEAPATLTD
jgi:hypothetical protein